MCLRGWASSRRAREPADGDRPPDRGAALNTDTPIIAVVSPKGGVGKTSVVANLASAFVQRGRPALTVDLDPQNATRLHFRMPYDVSMGLAVQGLQGLSLRSVIYRSDFGVDVLPYGIVAEEDRQDFEHLLVRDRDWLARQLGALELAPGAVVLIDSPPGGSVYLHQALRAARLALVVLLPDAASYATVPAMERWLDEETAQRNDEASSCYLVNRMNGARLLCRDVLAALQQLLGERLLPHQIHFDAAVEEALACHMPLLHYAGDSLAARDVESVSDWLLRRL